MDADDLAIVVAASFTALSFLISLAVMQKKTRRWNGLGRALRWRDLSLLLVFVYLAGQEVWHGREAHWIVWLLEVALVTTNSVWISRLLHVPDDGAGGPAAGSEAEG